MVMTHSGQQVWATLQREGGEGGRGVELQVSAYVNRQAKGKDTQNFADNGAIE
jgi:hypothetical protein